LILLSKPDLIGRIVIMKKKIKKMEKLELNVSEKMLRVEKTSYVTENSVSIKVDINVEI